MAFLMLICYATLWPWPLTRWPWKFVVHQASRDQSLYEIWAKSINPGWNIDNLANFCTRYVTSWPWPLTSWPKLLQHFGWHAFKLEWNWIIHSWVIDDLARFRRAILGDGAQLTELSQGCVQFGPNFTKLGRGIGRSYVALHFCFRLLISCCNSNAGSSKLSDVENDAKFSTLARVKIRRGMGE